MTEVFTDVGLAHIQTLIADGDQLVIIQLVIEQLNAGQRYNAVPTSRPILADGHVRRTSYVSPGPLDVSLFAANADISINLDITDDEASTTWAAYVFAQGLADPLIVISDDTTAFFVKPANEPGLINITWSQTQGVPSDIEVTWMPFPIANEAVARARASNSFLMSPLRVGQAIVEWWSAIGTKLSLRNIISMATAQQARLGNTDGIMTAELTAEAIDAQAEFASGAQARAGTNTTVYMSPDLTEEYFNHHIRAYEDGSLPNAVPPDGTIELVYEA